ncbi:MAG: SDR family oxidoreductase [Burkholderiales bacterium]|nr:SDR family oxidoreductase [Burkholderiales bacterium]
MNDSSRSLAGRIALITGGNSGIGLVTARELAQQGAQVFVACRSKDKGQAAVNDIQRATRNEAVEFLALDLGDFASVRRCAKDFLARDVPLHLLINNAGLAGAKGLTASGFELAFGTNHLGHFLLTQLLLDRIKASAPARIVTVASRAHTRVSGLKLDNVKESTSGKAGLPEYARSKLANVLFSAELGRRLAGTGVTTYSLHPGVVATDVWRELPGFLQPVVKLMMISSEEGAKTTLYCATAPAAANETGLYYDKCRAIAPSRAGGDAELAAELWRRSETWVA